MPNDRFEALTRELYTTLVEKRRYYGEGNILAVPKLMAELWPDGIKPEDYPTVLLIVRILDKLGRLTALHPSTVGARDAWKDIAGYALCALHDIVDPASDAERPIP